MNCPDCQTKTEVAETRTIEENPRWTKRRRVCKNCGLKLWTIESCGLWKCLLMMSS
jgi:transcriptional regulator NrdR family protein